MPEPHQRVQSGKLRKSGRSASVDIDTKITKLSTVVNTGIENSTPVEAIDYDDELSIYKQTPTDLCDYQIGILQKIATGFGVDTYDSIDKSWRCTWNIGAWQIGDTVSISINIMQPNIAGCWANISNTSILLVKNIAQTYIDHNLPRSKCTVDGRDTKVQLKGRWTPHVIDTLLKNKEIVHTQVSISNLNITQSKIFCWVLIGKESTYMCRLTKESLHIIVKYIPDWAIDIDEVNAGGSISLKIKSTDSDNDATQLTINDSGSIQYQGTSKYLVELPSALAIAIKSMMVSVHVRSFLNSLEYKLIVT